MINAIKKNAKVLTIAAILSTGLVAITHQLTASTIADQQRRQLLATLEQVIPATLYDNDLAQSCLTLEAPESLGTPQPMPAYLASQAGAPSAIAIEAIAPDGYNGNIHLVVGIDLEGKVLGVRILEHQETPGLGDKIDTRVTRWVDNFVGRRLSKNNQSDWQVRKDGGQFDQFTGATITPRAVVNAVRNAGLYFLREQTNIIDAAAQCEESA
ncbi:electron transport complex subunit RsxG [Thaumasiovibrio sp. DFM-14]|uniref:electron transport complex subunit RsxG n=1 Tax=Thaumasiovibrio sp. DFM-14 TaxID=3384792 RepID=UPI0039A32B08